MEFGMFQLLQAIIGNIQESQFVGPAQTWW
jgi:hypothetical protein